MRVLVLGSGLLGVTTAYVLASRGHAVEVVERQSASGAETSFANGGQLSYCHAEPWASPHVLRKLPLWLLHADSPLVFRPRLDAAMFRWGLSFLLRCRPGAVRESTLHMLRLGLYSRRKMQALVAETGIQFDHAEGGVLHLFTTAKELTHAKRQYDFQAQFGCPYSLLSREETIAMEPALAASQQPLAGAIHTPLDATGDAQLFCRELTRVCAEKLGVRFHFNTTVERILAQGGRIVGVETGTGIHHADSVVVALGSYSPLLLKPLGIHVPIYPMKGYSLTVPANAAAPRVSVTDGQHKIVFSRLGNRLRVAGTAEFAGYNDTILEQRIRPIVRAAKTLFPGVAWDAPLHQWACLRPSTPAGPPLLGPTPYANLFLNTGHGTLGWTQAAGSAHIVTDYVEGRAPEIATDGLTWRSL